MQQLPPGQHKRDDFPRFGLNQFAHRIPQADPLSIRVQGLVTTPIVLNAEALADVPRAEQTSDLHCVTTWSATGLRWSGWRFADVWTHCIAPQLDGDPDWLQLTAADGFRARLPLEDALHEDVLLADSLDEEALPLMHGGPLRFVAPRHYGYKNVKHLIRIDCVVGAAPFAADTPFSFMEHPRARVDLEERGRWPSLLLRWMYRPLIGPTVRRFADAWARQEG